ncbi:MAG: carboxymuconolactone decarboxylase family protein [Flavobacteriales bacterium]|nr:carboxymuconolactone decarboxylase family protein [Flavobacteriales bacterium]
MKNPLVHPISTIDNPELEELVQFFNETLGFCPNSVLTMQHRPHLAKAFVNLNMAVMQNEGRVTSALKRLIGYLSSYTAGCNYCQAHTIRAAERYGAEQDKLNNIWEYKMHPAFSDAEKAALDFAIAASTVPNAVTDEVAKNIRSHWDEGEIVEILGVISLFGYLNRWNDSMATPLENAALQSGKTYLEKKGWNPGKHLHQ